MDGRERQLATLRRDHRAARGAAVLDGERDEPLDQALPYTTDGARRLGHRAEIEHARAGPVGRHETRRGLRSAVVADERGKGALDRLDLGMRAPMAPGA